jgi:polysaccharide biosynthesis transport protein
MQDSSLGPGKLRIWPVEEQRATSQVEDNPLSLLRSVIAVMMWHKKKIVLWITVCVLLAAIMAALTPQSYTASATLLLGTPQRPGLDLAARPLDINRAESELQIIRSERLQTKVFDSLGLANHPEPTPRLSDVWELFPQLFTLSASEEPVEPDQAVEASEQEDSAKPPEQPAQGEPAEGEVPQDEPTATPEEIRKASFSDFAQRLQADRIGESYAVEISYTSADPVLAQQIVNSAVSAYLLQSVMAKADVTQGGLELVRERVEGLTTQIEAATKAMREGTLPGIAIPDADARIIGATLPEISPTGPGEKLIIAAGGVFGLISAIFVAAIASVLNQKVYTAEQLSRDSGLPCLAAVPLLSRRRTARLSRGAMSISGLGRQSAFTREIRNLRTSIKFSDGTGRGKKNKIVALASWEPQSAGSTLLSMSLARLMQESGKQVVVIDADLESARWGLSGNNPEGGDSLADALTEKNCPKKFEFLDINGILVLPARSSRRESNHIADFSDPKMAKVLDLVRASGDVLLDLPPLSVSADAKALAIYADVVVIVATTGRTTVEGLVKTEQLLRNAGANVIGAVLNEVR